MRVVLTGAQGFLGWHTRSRLRALSDHDVVPIGRADWSGLGELTQGADAIIHVAGVNRGIAHDVESGNVLLASDVAEAARRAGGQPRIVYANSVQAGNQSPYGSGKAAAAETLAQAAAELGADFVDVCLPNLFGEHGRPHYNSFVATFVEAVVNRETPSVKDRELTLLHAQDAAQALIDGLTGDSRTSAPPGTVTTVQEVYDLLKKQRTIYTGADLPPLEDDFEIDVFNTLRAALFPTHYPLDLIAHPDNRGRLVEVVRAHGGRGQTFVSTTKPGITRGDHFHLKRVERFVVLAGQARISLRRLFNDELVSFDVDGERPQVVDMPTMWVHNIQNTGKVELTTTFWSHDLFDPQKPDTYWERVCRDGATICC